MLKYKINPKIGVSLSEFKYRDFYVSPDLSFISGVTDSDVNLVDGETVYIKTPFIYGTEATNINVSNARRQGKIAVKVELPVKHISKVLYFELNTGDEPGNEKENTDFTFSMYNGSYDKVTSSMTGEYRKVYQNYVVYNGDISYFFNGVDSSQNSEECTNCGYFIGNKFYHAERTDTSIIIDDYLYIDDGVLNFDDDVTYYADFSKMENGEYVCPDLRISKYVDPIKGGDFLGTIGENSFSAATSYESEKPVIIDYKPSEWVSIKKFIMNRNKDRFLSADTVCYGFYKHYVVYNDKNYYLDEVYKDGEYLGYGIVVDGGFYECNLQYNIGAQNDEAVEYYNTFTVDKDEKFTDRFIWMENEGYNAHVENTLSISKNHGSSIVIILHDEKNDIIPGNVIRAKCAKPISFIKNVEYGINETPMTIEELSRMIESGDKETVERLTNDYIRANPYISFLGKKYDIEKKIYDTINIGAVERRLIYTDDFLYSTAYIEVKGEVLEFDIKYYAGGEEVSYDDYEEYEGDDKYSTATYDKNMYYKVDDESPLVIRYGILDNAFLVTENSGVTINGNVYKVKNLIYESELDELIKEEDVNGGNIQPIGGYYVALEESVDILLEVIEINGSSTLICKPKINEGDFSEYDEKSFSKDLITLIGDNSDSFYFTLIKNTYGEVEYIAENGLMNSMRSLAPYTISNSSLLKKKIRIYRAGSYISMDFPLSNGVGINMLKDDYLQNLFLDEYQKNSINSIVDMEKDVYYPAFKDGDKFMPIKQLRFNMHFRTRNLDNWKVIEDDREYNKSPFSGGPLYTTDSEYTPNSKLCNWFVTDYDYYKKMTGENLKSLQNSSDLIGYMNFTDGDVYNRAAKIGKSFLRLSFYSTNNPNTQVLLGTSTIFLDESAILTKSLSLKRNSSLKFINTKQLQGSGEISYTEDGLKYYTSSASSVMSESFNESVLFIDALRLSSRLNVYDKYLTSSSSEGFYLYMFKQYTNNMREGIIYMRADFNHAGIGKAIPMYIPRHDIDSDGIGIPCYIHKSNDLTYMKKGFKLNEAYKQIYLPIYVKFDDETSKYYYYLPDILRENDELGVDDEIMEFNLFEIKFANESIVNLNEGN